MGISPKLLAPGEEVVASTRTHWKALILPALTFIVTSAILGFLIAVLPSGSTHTPLLIALLVVAVVVVIIFSLRQLLVWLTATYTVTNRRLIARTGVFVRRGRDIPLYRITDVSYERGVLDRMLGCGTLIISDASTQGRSVLHDVPHVEKLQLLITDLLLSKDDGADDDGTPSNSLPPTS